MNNEQTKEITTTQMNPGQLLELAINKDVDVEKLGKLMELQKQWQADQARKAFFAAFTEFQSKCPDIRKTKTVQFESKNNGAVSYSFAPLADIARQIAKPMKDHDLSFRWEIQDDQTNLKVTCIISHIDGHSEQTTMSSTADTSGAKNPIQARGSAIEYLKRYTLTGALGITTADSDIDGRMGDYEIDVDRLHKTFMEVYNQVLLLDPTQTRLNPDNWLIERTGRNYIKAIGDIRKLLFDLQQKHKK